MASLIRLLKVSFSLAMIREEENGYELPSIYGDVLSRGFTILNHATKHPTPSLDKDSATESKACDLVKFLDPEKETLFYI